MVKAIGLPLVLAAALGAVGGWLWWLWWGPAPRGQVHETADGRQWFPVPFDPGVARDFGGTATYVVIAVVLGLALGLATAFLARDRAVPGLAAAVGAGVLGAVLMAVVGTAQSPDNPHDKVDDVAVGTKLPGHLHVTHGELTAPRPVADLLDLDDRVVELPTPHLVWPFATTLGYLVLMLALLNGRPSLPAQPSAEPARQG